MLRVIFDTNIYGFLIKETDLLKLQENLVSDKQYIIYGFTLLRKELRDIPKDTVMSRRTRTALLILYDEITKGRTLLCSQEVYRLAEEYHAYYRRIGGIYAWNTNINVDFKLVACASISNLDVVYTADRKTLMSKQALDAYEKINSKYDLKTPAFIEYIAILQRLRNHFNR